MNPIRRWAPALRMARREAWRAKGRSLLVLTMIALPVLAVTAADIVIQTSDVKGGEAIERRVGGADALVTVDRDVVDVVQTPDPDQASNWTTRPKARPRTLDDVSEALGREVDAVEIVRGGRQVATDAGATYADVVETDLTSPLTDGIVRVTDGRVPAAVGEVAVNGELADRGSFAIGDRLELEDGSTLTIVGIVENTVTRSSAIAVAPPGGFGLKPRPGQHTWLVDAGGAVTWDDVQALNAVGATVWSRAVLADPPPDSEIDPELGWATGTGTDDAWLAVVALVVVMALLEVVLLAGPAFAVIARRLQRSLALMAANGATPPQGRKVVLASGLVLGGAGAVLGVGLGLLVAWLALPVVQQFSSSYLGPYDVPWLHLLGIAGFGLVSALLAAVVPAWVASRQDVVAVLAGRRGDRKPSLRSPLLGLLLLGGGVALAAYGAASGSGGEYVIAVSAIVAVLGMLLLIPIVVVALARVARRLPLPLRFAVRDAARHRTRTVPAVAAVAATVAGVVALGIGTASDAEQRRATYTPMLAVGQASITPPPDVDLAQVEEILERYVPDAEVTPVLGPTQRLRRYTYVEPKVDGDDYVLSGFGSTLSTFPISDDGTIPPHLTGLSDAERAAGERVLAAGGAVIFTDQGLDADEVELVARSDGSGVLGRATVSAVFVETTQVEARAQGVLSLEAASALGVDPVAEGLLVQGAITAAQEEAVNEALLALDAEASMYVERGYQEEDDTVIVQLVLGGLGAVLMLGGTLTATFLSLSDARPDLATLSAVGASPRTRRAVAASYALVIALVGALLGVGVGLIPGIAVTYPLTGAEWVQDIDPSLPTHFLAVPWLLIGSLVIALPLLTAALVGAFTRSRLPMVARID